MAHPAPIPHIGDELFWVLVGEFEEKEGGELLEGRCRDFGAEPDQSVWERVSPAKCCRAVVVRGDQACAEMGLCLRLAGDSEQQCHEWRDCAVHIVSIVELDWKGELQNITNLSTMDDGSSSTKGIARSEPMRSDTGGLSGGDGMGALSSISRMEGRESKNRCI